MDVALGRVEAFELVLVDRGGCEQEDARGLGLSRRVLDDGLQVRLEGG
jgi:hypothetical protein